LVYFVRPTVTKLSGVFVRFFVRRFIYNVVPYPKRMVGLCSLHHCLRLLDTGPTD
jgi:hypothetical protein